MNDTQISRIKVPDGRTIEINNRVYPVTDLVKTVGGRFVPLVNIPVMSDERWNEIARSPEHQARLHEVSADG